jgi:hypothetical protein
LYAYAEKLKEFTRILLIKTGSVVYHVITVFTPESHDLDDCNIPSASRVLYHTITDWNEMQQLQGGGFIADTQKPNRN